MAISLAALALALQQPAVLADEDAIACASAAEAAEGDGTVVLRDGLAEGVLPFPSFWQR